MAGRFDSSLRAHFDSGALGFTGNGEVAVRDASKIALSERVAVNKAVADQNRDARAVYREIAAANKHPEGESQRSEEHTSELQSLMRISYAGFCLKKKKNKNNQEYNI